MQALGAALLLTTLQIQGGLSAAAAEALGAALWAALWAARARGVAAAELVNQLAARGGELARFGRATRRLGLQHLQLGFVGCDALRDIAELGRGVGALQGLQHLQLNFSDCEALSESLQQAFTSSVEFLAAVGM